MFLWLDVPLVISIGWLRASESTRKTMLIATAGVASALLGVPVAWARLYLGVHFPFDMLGAVAVAALSAWLTLRETRWYPEPGDHLATGIHRRLFDSLIALGWVRE